MSPRSMAWRQARRKRRSARAPPLLMLKNNGKAKASGRSMMLNSGSSRNGASTSLRTPSASVPAASIWPMRTAARGSAAGTISIRLTNGGPRE